MPDLEKAFRAGMPSEILGVIHKTPALIFPVLGGCAALRWKLFPLAGLRWRPFLQSGCMSLLLAWRPSCALPVRHKLCQAIFNPIQSMITRCKNRMTEMRQPTSKTF